MASVTEGDLVCLMDGDGRRYLVRARDEPAYVKGVGTFDHGDLLGRAYGSTWTEGNKTFHLLEPTTVDLMLAARRKAQIVQPKDAARILLETGLAAGHRVLESGIGSGVLTTALARAVAPDGEVVSYEIREDFAGFAQGNLARAGLDDLVRVEVRDATEGIDEEELDAVVLDLPEPDEVVPHAAGALKGSGVLAAYTPHVSQVERVHDALRDHGFHDLRTLEVLERTWTVADHGSRPDHHALGHTAFLTFGRNGTA